MLDAFLTNCRLADGRVVDIGIADGKIAIVGEGAAPTSSNSAPALDIGGDAGAVRIVGRMRSFGSRLRTSSRQLASQSLRPRRCQPRFFTRR